MSIKLKTTPFVLVLDPTYPPVSGYLDITPVLQGTTHGRKAKLLYNECAGKFGARVITLRGGPHDGMLVHAVHCEDEQPPRTFGLLDDSSGYYERRRFSSTNDDWWWVNTTDEVGR